MTIGICSVAISSLTALGIAVRGREVAAGCASNPWTVVRASHLGKRGRMRGEAGDVKGGGVICNGVTDKNIIPVYYYYNRMIF